MTVVSPRKASRFFRAKMDFTTGPVELSRMIEAKEGMAIIDVRSSEDYAKGHIPHAINLPEDSWKTPFGLRRDRPNVIYCYSENCHLAASAAKMFADQGYPVVELDGGFDDWVKHDLTVET